MKLDSLKDGKHFGRARLSQHPDLHAEFVLAGSDTFVVLHSASPLGYEMHDLPWLPVVLPDGTMLTFVDNVLTSLTTRRTDEGLPHAAHFLPHYVIVGRQQIDDTVLLSDFQFRCDDAPNIFYDFDAFSIALDSDSHAQAIFAAQESRINRKIKSGDHPVLAYFTGKSEIFSIDTVLGQMSASHSPTYSMGGPRGVSIDNRIFLRIVPPAPVGFHKAIELMMPVLRFFLIVAGRRQEILDFYIRPREVTNVPPLEVYWCREPVPRPLDSDSPSPGDIPVNGGINPDLFARVLAGWLYNDDARRDARLRFSQVFARGNRYDEDRIVGAANMFDLLPPGAAPQTDQIAGPLKKARDSARHLFKALPESAERSSLLQALGRLGQPSLKQKVRHRAQILLAASSGRFPDLDVVLDEAVNCRNHFVHGGTTDPGLADSFRNQVPFFVDSLEFVFATSEFLEVGWKFDEWVGRGTSMTHPWGAYCVSYGDRLAILKNHSALRKSVEASERRARRRSQPDPTDAEDETSNC